MTRPRPDRVLCGVDAGGTRSTAIVADGGGRLLGRADGGPANYQSIGAEAARASLHDVVARALSAARVEPGRVDRAGYGVAGADRPKDFRAIERQLPQNPPPERRTLVNDSALALWAGTPDAVGVAVVSGTGTNAIGRARGGRVSNVGGFCYELGDDGSATDLGREALRRAMRGRDGRGPETALYGKLCAALGVDPLEDVLDLWMADAAGPSKHQGLLAPLVFEAAAEGDAVARDILERAGRDLALGALVLIDRLHAAEPQVPVVLGGSVLQKGADPTLVRALVAELGRSPVPVRPLRLAAEPAVGAVLLALDGLRPEPAQRAAFVAELEEQIGSPLAVEI